MLPSAYEWYFLFQSFHQVLPVSEQEISLIFPSKEDFINNIYYLLNLKVEIPKYFWLNISASEVQYFLERPDQYNLYVCMCELLGTYSWVYRCAAAYVRTCVSSISPNDPFLKKSLKDVSSYFHVVQNVSFCKMFHLKIHSLGGWVQKETK